MTQSRPSPSSQPPTEQIRKVTALSWLASCNSMKEGNCLSKKRVSWWIVVVNRAAPVGRRLQAVSFQSIAVRGDTLRLPEDAVAAIYRCPRLLDIIAGM